MHQNTWKWGEVTLSLSPPPGGQEKKKIDRNMSLRLTTASGFYYVTKNIPIDTHMSQIIEKF